MSAKRAFNYLKKKYGINTITSKTSGYSVIPKYPELLGVDGIPDFMKKSSSLEIRIVSGGLIEIGFGTNYDEYCGSVFGWFELPDEIKSASGFCINHISVGECCQVPDSELMTFDLFVSTDDGMHLISAFYAPTRPGGNLPLYMLANVHDGMASLLISPSSFVDLTAEEEARFLSIY